MAGLLDILSGADATPEQSNMLMGLAAGLLSANGSQGLSAGILGMNKAKDDMLKRQDLAQQIQLRALQAAQQQRQFDLQTPFLEEAARRMRTQSGGQAPSVPSDAITSPGAFVTPAGGVGPVAPLSEAPAALTRPASNGQGGSPMFPGVPDSVAFGIIGTGGFGEIPKAISSYNAPTDLMKTLTAAGLQPGSPQWNQALAANVAKLNSPTRLGNAGYFDPAKGFVPLPAAAPPGFINIPDATNPSGYKAVPIGGGPAAVQAAATARTSGEGLAIPYAGVDAVGQPLPVTSRTAAATQGQIGAPPAQADNPNIPASTPYQRAASDVTAIQRQIADVTRSMAPAATKKMQLDILNQELAKANAGAQPPAQAPGAIYAAPPLGAVTGADASQKAPAQSMRDSYTRLQSVGNTANMATDALDKMLSLAANKNPLLTAGVLGTHQSAVNTDAAEYEKQRANVIALMAQQLGAGGTDAGRANIGESVPDFGKPKAAIADGLGTLRNQVVALQLKRQLLTPVYQSGDSKAYTTLENQFDQNVSPSMVPLLTMQPGKQRAAALSSAAQDPAMKSRLNWAAENGLLK